MCACVGEREGGVRRRIYLYYLDLRKFTDDVSFIKPLPLIRDFCIETVMKCYKIVSLEIGSSLMAESSPFTHSLLFLGRW